MAATTVPPTPPEPESEVMRLRMAKGAGTLEGVAATITLLAQDCEEQQPSEPWLNELAKILYLLASNVEQESSAMSEAEAFLGKSVA